MRQSYVLVTAPAVEPVTLAELKTQCRIDHDDEDVMLAGLIQTAREQAELELRRAIITQTWRLTTDYFPAWGFEISKPPVQSITSITYPEAIAGVTTTLSAALYSVETDSEPAWVYPAYNQSWPDIYGVPNQVRITFVAGYASPSLVPRVIKQGILMLASHLYENREPVNIGNIVNEIPMTVQRLWGGARWGSYP